MTNPKKLIKEFERMRGMAELHALSAVSLERQLTDQEYQKMMQLKREVLEA